MSWRSRLSLRRVSRNWLTTLQVPVLRMIRRSFVRKPRILRAPPAPQQEMLAFPSSSHWEPPTQRDSKPEHCSRKVRIILLLQYSLIVLPASAEVHSINPTSTLQTDSTYSFLPIPREIMSLDDSDFRGPLLNQHHLRQEWRPSLILRLIRDLCIQGRPEQLPSIN